MSEEPPIKKESLWRRWVVKPVVQQLSQGTEPRKIALAMAFGVTLGIFPLLGTPTLLSLGVGIPLKLNQPVLHVFRELAYPLHLATILLFIHAGAWLFGVPDPGLSIPVMLSRFRASPAQFMADFGLLGLYAVCVWAIIAPFLLGSVYMLALPLVTRLAKRFTPAADAA